MPHETIKQKRKNYQEIRLLLFLNGHANILKFIRATVTGTEVWMVTDFIQGGSLTQVLNPFFSSKSPRRVYSMFFDLGSGWPSFH